jgi:hypothetical protein
MILGTISPIVLVLILQFSYQDLVLLSGSEQDLLGNEVGSYRYLTGTYDQIFSRLSRIMTGSCQDLAPELNRILHCIILPRSYKILHEFCRKNRVSKLDKILCRILSIS